MKINNSDFELHYTLDNGTNWTRDTLGLPKNIVQTGNPSLIVKDMGNGYLMAYNNRSTSYKQAGTASWTQVNISYQCTDVTSLNDVWYVVIPI